MVFLSLDILNKALLNLSSIKTWENALTAKQVKKETISSLDELWLNNEANTVDEEHVIEALGAWVAYLDKKEKVIGQKLRERAGELTEVVGRKNMNTLFSRCKAPC